MEKQLKSARSKILNSYLTTIEESFQENRPQLKLINYGTGSGKTYQLFEAIYQTIQQHREIQSIGIYVAPLREHLSVPNRLKNQYPDIPVYTINSLELKTTDKFIKLYKQWIPLILKDQELWQQISKNSSQEKAQKKKENLEKVKGFINRLEYIQNSYFGDHNFKEFEEKRVKQEINYSLEDFLYLFIQCQFNQESWSKECLKLIEIFFPLHLLREKSGILMLTYQKLETKIPYFTNNGKTWIKKEKYLDQYVAEPKNDWRKFIFAFDEQEEGYQIMLEKKIDIISPQKLAINNALSSISREFSLLFSAESEKNLDFLIFLEKNQGALSEFPEHFERAKELEPPLAKFADTYYRLIYEEGNSINFLEKVITLKKGIEQSIAEIITVLNQYHQEEPLTIDFEMLARVFSKFQNNRSLLISQKLYNKISDELMNIFAYNNVYIYNIELLKELFVDRDRGGHVRITEEKTSDQTSVAELVYAILAARSQIKKIQEFLANVLDAEDSQSRSLDIWSKQITEAQKVIEENTTKHQVLKYLNRLYVYESYKSIININEISRYQNPKNNLVNPSLREISIGSTSILTSPEFKIISMLKNSSNVMFMISATGGITGDLSTSYDLTYLEDSLRETGQSSFKGMNQEEISLCKEIRTQRKEMRNVSVNFFNEDVSSFPNDETKEVVQRFEKKILKSFCQEQEVIWNRYKRQELERFIRFLFYLFEDDSTQETIAFTQTLKWIRKLTEYCSKLPHDDFKVEASSEHPNIYYFQVKHQLYQSKIRIKIIFYESNFNRKYHDRITEKTYLDELVEEEGQKIFFISAYQSASKGLNPIIKDENGEEKDFDALILLMDKYYTMMKSPRKRSTDFEKLTARYHFALMKSIVNLSEANLEIKDFNQYLNQPEAREFKENQHQILLGKEVLQAIGRAERRDYQDQNIQIFINGETQENLANFYRYLQDEEKQEIDKLSVNNYEVYLRVQEEENKQAIPNYDVHVDDEIDAYFAFQQFREEMLNDIEKFHQNKKASKIVKTWDMLRDKIVFKEPDQYLNQLRESKRFDEEFIKSLFYQKPEEVRFTPYLALEEDRGKPIKIISDRVHGEKAYSYLDRLYPEYLKTTTRDKAIEEDSTELIYKLYNQLLPNPEIFKTYIPRPYFFYDVLYPSFSEHFIKHWIKKVIFKDKDWEMITKIYGFEELQLRELKKYNKLYEQFDLYYRKEDTLFCIDVKAWSIASGNHLSQETLKKTQDKLDKILSDYPGFSAVRGLLLNLHAPKERSHQHSLQLFSGNFMYFDDDHRPVESDILKNFLFCKEK